MHDLVVRDLERARNRTLGLTDLDDPTLVTQHDPLMSPLVWDLAHVGQQEGCKYLRGGNRPRPGAPASGGRSTTFKPPARPRCRPPPLRRGPTTTKFAGGSLT
jgi:iron(II)-dependent oxidoreductase